MQFIGSFKYMRVHKLEVSPDQILEVNGVGRELRTRWPTRHLDSSYGWITHGISYFQTPKIPKEASIGYWIVETYCTVVSVQCQINIVFTLKYCYDLKFKNVQLLGET